MDLTKGRIYPAHYYYEAFVVNTPLICSHHCLAGALLFVHVIDEFTESQRNAVTDFSWYVVEAGSNNHNYSCSPHGAYHALYLP